MPRHAGGVRRRAALNRDRLPEQSGCHGLLTGYISRFAPFDDATAIDPNAWHAMCRNALALASPQMIEADI